MRTIEEYQNINRNLSQKIARAEIDKDHQAQMKLKRELYGNKLKMIDLLEFQNKKNNISAKGLIHKVKNMPKINRYKTGLLWLDKELSFNPKDESEPRGFEVGSLILLGGESGAGKSHIMLDILCNVSKYAKCVFYNFEMGDRRLSSRLEKRLTTEMQLTNFIVNSECRKLEELIMEINISAQDGIKFFVIDSRMKIEVAGKDPEYLKISNITKKLSEVAVKNDVIIFLINQISEENLKNKNLSFKGSGDQIYDADMAFFLTKENDAENENDKTRMLICKKNRQDERWFSVVVPKIETVTEYVS